MAKSVDRGDTLTVDRTVVLWHVCLQLAHDGRPRGVALTTNPLEFDAKSIRAQIVMHKTRSLNCAQQVGRFVRRTWELEDACSVHRATRPVEAMIGYACSGGYQYGPENVRDEIIDVVKRMAGMSIQEMLDEVKDGVSAGRTRYIVYEVRARRLNGAPIVLRGVTNKMHSVERVWRQCPPDTLRNADVVHVGKFATREEAEHHLQGFHHACNQLWTRRPSVEYMRRILKLVDRGEFSGRYEVIWTADGTSAIRHYESTGPVVVIGPHVYTLEHVMYCLERGAWYDGMFRKASGPEERTVLTTNLDDEPD